MADAMNETVVFGLGGVAELPGHPAVTVWRYDDKGVVRVEDGHGGWEARRPRGNVPLTEFSDIPDTELQIRLARSLPPLEFEVRVRPADLET
jgi:hypothetical protein